MLYTQMPCFLDFWSCFFSVLLSFLFVMDDDRGRKVTFGCESGQWPRSTGSRLEARKFGNLAH